MEVGKLTEKAATNDTSGKEFKNLLDVIGFSVSVVKTDKGYLHPHILYICRKSPQHTSI